MADIVPGVESQYDIPWYKRLSYTQSRNALLVALIITTLMSFALVVKSVQLERETLEKTIQQIAEIVSMPASQALYNFDEDLGLQIGEGLVRFQSIYHVALVDEYGDTLASRSRPRLMDNWGWITKHLSPDEMEYSFDIMSPKSPVLVGQLLLKVDFRRALGQLLGGMTSILLLGFVSTLFFSIALSFIFNRSLTSPLVAIIRRLAAVLPNQPGKSLLSVPTGHENDELGLLVATTNRLLKAMDANLETRRDMESKLVETEYNFRRIVENAIEGIVQTGPEGQVLSANPAMFRMLGYDGEASFKQAAFDANNDIFFDPMDRAALLYCLSEAGSVSEFQTRLMHRDGSILWVSIKARSVLDENGSLEFIDAIVEDITERKKALDELARLNIHLEEEVEKRTRELAERNEELENANFALTKMDQVKSGLLSMVSHELRTPLTSILGFAKLIDKDFSTSFQSCIEMDKRLLRRSRRIHDNLGIIVHEGERLTRLISDFLDLEKIESGRILWNEKDIDIFELLRDVVDTVSGQFLEKPDVRFEVEIADDAQLLHVDPDRLKQVCVNLLNNAVKFTDSGYIAFRAARVDSVIRISVEDTGIGIPQEEHKKIFGKFYQVGQPDMLGERPRGTGLGLAISLQIIEHYGGSIHVESEVGKGSVFHIDIPIEQNTWEYLFTEGESLDMDISGTQPLILVVDDDPGVRSFLRQFLISEGYRVLTASNGEQALQIAHVKRPDLVTMDLLMPVMGGKDTIAEFRKDTDLASIPIMVISVMGDQDDHNVADAALSKPIDEERLVDIIGSLLGGVHSNEPALALQTNGKPDIEPAFALARERLEYCSEHELYDRLNSGFQGTVIVSSRVASAVDFERLASYNGVQVLLLPDSITSSKEH